MIESQPVTVDRMLPLRHEILRVGLPIESARLADDF